MNKILKQYAELKIKEKEITDKLNALKEEVTSLVFAEDGEKIETDLGRFEMRPGRKVWKYSEELRIQEAQALEALKSKKKQEEISGKATLEKAPMSLVFTMNKGK